MAEREWQPGDVAIVAFGDGTEERVFREGYGYNGDGTARWFSASNGQCYVVDRSAYRPLVVIDPEDREQVNRIPLMFGTLCRADGSPISFGDWQDALREFADPKPPKPDEPTGLGAVVEDVAGNHWTRIYANPGVGEAWYCDNPLGGGHKDGQWQHYMHLDAVKVLSEGVS